MKKKISSNTLSTALLAVFSLIPMTASAAITTITGSQTLAQIIGKVITWILAFVGVLAVLMLIIGGVRYVISAGNPAQTEGAKKTIIYALVGIVIVILAVILVNAVSGLFGGGNV